MLHSHTPSGQRPLRKFKGVTVIDWDTEPAEERPSQFADSTLYADLLGAPATRGRGKRQRGGLGAAWLALAIVLGVGTIGMMGLVHLLRG